MPELVCIGNLTIDESVQADGTSTTSAGGDALFAALAARHYLPTTRVLAPVGDDLSGELIEALDLAGTNGATLPHRALPTVRNIVTYDERGGRTWQLLHGDDHFDAMSVYPPDLSADALSADGILTLAMSLQSQTTLGPWLRTHSKATQYLDLQEDYLDEVAALTDLIASCDVFLPSEVEATALAGTTDLTRAALYFRGLGPHTIVIKLAERGCVVLPPESDELVAIASGATRVVDTTGAGDAFCGAFAAVHLLTGDPVAAAHAGVDAAAAALSDFGLRGIARFSRPNLSQEAV